MTIENRNDATERYASGILTPWMRVLTHIGYCYATANNTSMTWNDRLTDIRSDLREAQAHLQTATDPTAFISADARNRLDDVRVDINDALSVTEEEEVKVSLAHIAHNTCAAIAKVEFDLIGRRATAGTEI